MSSPIFFVLLFFLAWDTRLLQRLHPPGPSKDPSHLSRGAVLACVAVIAPLALFCQGAYFMPGVSSVFLPLYLFRRMKFLRYAKGMARAEGSRAVPISFLSVDAVGIVLFWFLGLMIFSAGIEGGSRFFPFSLTDLEISLSLSTFSFLWMFFLIQRVLRQYPGLSLWGVAGFRQGLRPIFLKVLFPVCAGIFFAGVSTFLLFSRPAQPDTPFNQLMETATSSRMILAFALVAVLVAPFFEEVIFRGFFFYVIRQFKGVRVAFVTVALSFAVLHYYQYWGDWEALVMITVLGFVLSAFRTRTGSCIPGIFMHYAYNAAVTIIPVLMLAFSSPSYMEYQIRYDQLSFQEKEELLLKSIQNDPAFADAYNDLAWLYARAGENLDSAIYFIERALSLSPQEPAFLDTKAEILYRQGKFQEAINIERTLTRKYPENEFYREQLERFQEALPLNK